jgi:Transport and Golgi organisation 2
MCTVSLVPAGTRLRLLCNRDERHTRPSAWPPTVTRAGDHLALLPLDPLGGGTWIAASAAGLAFALLNRDSPSGAPALSRGRLILELLDAESLDDVIAGARRACRRDWPGHRLIVTDGARALELQAGISGLRVHEQAVDQPLLYTSSSVDADLAAAARRALFEQMVVHAADVLDGQDAFHRHRWRDRPHLSVHMRRHDAATQSITMVEITPATVRMRYESTTELVGLPASLSIDRTRMAGTAVELDGRSDLSLPVLAAAS